VADSGPLNPHFVRDVGCAYVVAGLGLLWRAFDPVRGWPAALAGATFLLMHAGIHAIETLTGHQHGAPWADLLAIHGLALLVLWLAWPGRREPGGVWLPIRGALHRRVRAFENAFSYDAAYLHEMLDISMAAFMCFAKIEKLARYREQVPIEAWYAAKLTAAMHEDCGPCTQLVVDMAIAEGMSAAQLTALVDGDTHAMNDAVALGYRFAKATLARDIDATDLRAQIHARWGARAVVSLALAIAGARVFPTVKYAMGHGQSCSRIRISDRQHDVPPRIAAIEAAH
jgi:hypothetical protein